MYKVLSLISSKKSSLKLSLLYRYLALFFRSTFTHREEYFRYLEELYSRRRIECRKFLYTTFFKGLRGKPVASVACTARYLSKAELAMTA